MATYKLYCWSCGFGFEYDTEYHKYDWYKPLSVSEMFCRCCGRNTVHLTTREQYLEKIKELEKEDEKFSW